MAAAPEVLAETQDAHERDWAALINCVAQGDQYALDLLYERSNRLLFGLVLRIVGDISTAEEVLLDVYMQVWRQAGRYEARRGKPLAWLVTMARSRAIDRLRAGRQEETRKEQLDTSDRVAQMATAFEDPTVAPELRRIVRAALDALPPEQREVIELAYYLGLSPERIAERLGQPLGTVKTRTRLAMTKLREQLKDSRGVL